MNKSEQIQFDELVQESKTLFKNMTDEERIEFRDQIMEDYCFYCGTEHLPCHRDNDE